MIPLTRPPHTVRDVVDLCIAGRMKASNSKSLRKSVNALELAEKQYDDHGQRKELYLLPSSSKVGSVSRDEMINLYENRLCKAKGNANAIYNRLMLGPTDLMCPLCGQRKVNTIDHYLAKSRHARYAVTPLNLVPACRECNTLKLEKGSEEASDQPLHPYFDDVTSAKWLAAAVVDPDAPRVAYTAKPPTHWDVVLQDRVRTHFKLYELASLYAAHAGVFLSGIKKGLVAIGDRDGDAAVKSHLAGEAESWKGLSRNHWTHAMYLAATETEWFWRGGYRNIDA